MLNTIKSIFVLLFLTLLSLPAVQGAFAPFSFEAVQENKARPVFPDGSMLEKLWSDPTYSRRVEEWFNGVFPLRDIYIRISNQIKYSLYSESREVLIGSNGWITDKVVAKSLMPIDHLTDDQIISLHRRITQFNDYLKTRGIKLVIVPVPLKNELYRKELTFPSLSRPE